MTNFKIRQYNRMPSGKQYLCTLFFGQSQPLILPYAQSISDFIMFPTPSLFCSKLFITLTLALTQFFVQLLCPGWSVGIGQWNLNHYTTQFVKIDLSHPEFGSIIFRDSGIKDVRYSLAIWLSYRLVTKPFYNHRQLLRSADVPLFIMYGAGNISRLFTLLTEEMAKATDAALSLFPTLQQITLLNAGYNNNEAIWI